MNTRSALLVALHMFRRPLAILVAITCISAVNADKLLRWKLHPGQTLQVQFIQEMGLETKLLDQPVQTSADMAMQMTWQVQRILPEGVAETKQSIDRVWMAMESPGSPPVSYDSAKSEELQGVAKTLADSIEPMLGIEFLQQMDARGEILDVRLTDAAQQKLAQSPGATDMNDMFSKEGLRSLLSQAATVLPEKAVAPGTQWTGTSETKSPVGNLRMENTYIYRGTETRNGRELERIDVTMQVFFDRTDNSVGLKVDVSDQQNSGTMYFDATAGRFVESTIHQKMTLATAVGQQTYQQKLDTQLRMVFTDTSERPAISQPATATPAASTATRPRPSGAARR